MKERKIVMKFLREATAKGLRILPAELKASGFSPDERTEIHVLDDAIVILKHRMTAIELIRTMYQLVELSADLTGHLTGVCGHCEDCDDGCPADDLDSKEISLPDYLREEAGIPEDAKLCAIVDEENGTVTIAEAEHEYDLRDIPPRMLDMFLGMDLCLGRLEKLLMDGGAVYEG